MSVLGVLGGTFDPVHLGHLHVASGVRTALDIPRVLLVPCSIPPHKVRPGLTSSEHRLAMLRLAVAGRDGLEASSLELDRGGVSYTIDTLRALRQDRRPAPVFVLGLDALLEIRLWREYEALLEEFDLIAVDRPGSDLRAVRASLEPDLAFRLVAADSGSLGGGGRIHHLQIPPMPVSSSEVRALAARGMPLDGLVPPEVAGYIQSHGLYRQEV
jgi:nicotinate-nucleotide adenylyltransferase